MSKFKHDLLLRVVKGANVLLMTLPFFLCWYWYYADRIASPYYAMGNYLVIGLFFVLYYAFGKIYDGFLISYSRISEIVYSQALAAGFSDFLMYVVTWLLMKHLPNVLPMLVCLAAQIGISSIWAQSAHNWYFKTFPPKSAAVIFDERIGLSKLINQYGLDGKFTVKVKANVSEVVGHPEKLDGISTVFLSGIHSHERNVILKYCIAHDIDVFVIPRLGDTIMSGAKSMHMFHLPMLRVGRYNPPPEYLFFKRAFDIIASGLALVVLSPLFLITAIAVKSDGGPALYSQVRLGRGGKPFKIYKFRSMRVDAEKDGVARLSTGDKDDRITPVGRIIRKCRLDELPQLWLIFVGTLSLCGPRPERPSLHAEFCKEMPEFDLRLQAKQGLTGYAQVYGKYNTTPYDKLQMDLMYIAHPSIIEDLKIMLATVKILFQPESTEGVAEVQETVMGLKDGNSDDAAMDCTRSERELVMK
jgi:lipopolysaccharide/colanic/teichoic acid biosynthesis glycosyltransferase